MPTFTGLSHVAFTVRDPQASARWYRDVFGLTPLPGDEAHGVLLLVHPETKLLFVLRRNPERDGPFSENRTGLDHLSFLVSGKVELERWQRRLADLGVRHSPIAYEDYGSVLVFRDPDNIQLEFFAVPGS
jgi:glyoxylase I family protein